MITLDPRIGSGELYKYLTESLHLPVQVAPLKFGDLAFLGDGPEGCPTPVGIERKALTDFITSCRSERLQGHQLPGLYLHYQQVWIIVEGTWKRDWKTGCVLIPKGKSWVPLVIGSTVSWDELMGRVITLKTKAKVQVEFTSGKSETGHMVRALYRWWDKGYDAHGSHQGFPDLSDSAQLVQYDRDNPQHLVRLMVKEAKGIGWEKSGAVAGQFKSPCAMVQASEKSWTGIPGIGKGIAKRLWKALHGEGCSHESAG